MSQQGVHTWDLVYKGALDQLGRGPFEFEFGGDGGRGVQHDGVVRVCAAAAPELLLHTLRAHDRTCQQTAPGRHAS